MAQTVFKAILWAIPLLMLAGMILVGVTDPAVFHRHFYGDAPFDLFSFIGDIWPRPILTALVAVSVALALGSDRLHDYLGSLKMSGSSFMLLTFAACVLAMVLLVYAGDFSYPEVFEPETTWSKLLRIFAVMAVGIMGFPFLVIVLNDSLARPAPMLLLIGLWLMLFTGFDVWRHFLFTGELDLLVPLRRFFG